MDNFPTPGPSGLQRSNSRYHLRTRRQQNPSDNSTTMEPKVLVKRLDQTEIDTLTRLNCPEQGRNLGQKTPAVEPPKPENVCGHCGALFNIPSLLKIHLRLHADDFWRDVDFLKDLRLLLLTTPPRFMGNPTNRLRARDFVERISVELERLKNREESDGDFEEIEFVLQ